MRANDLFFDEVILEDLKYIIKISAKLRWLIGLGVLLIPYLLQKFDFFVKPAPVAFTGVAILLYNIFFYLLIPRKEPKDKKKKINFYKKLGKVQIFFDYITLAATLYFIGGVHTNLFYVLIFHLIIGSIILNAAYMYFIVIISLLSFYLVSILELNDFLPYYNFYNLPNLLTYKTINTEFLIHFVILIGSVLMISVLTNRIKSDTIQIKKTKDNLEKNFEIMKSLEIRKSKFMRYSAHQLRSPLATIISALNVLTLKMIPLDSDRAHNLLNGTINKARDLLHIINNLLELSRIREERKNQKLDEDINLIELIEQILFSLTEKIELKELEIIRVYHLTGKNYKYNEKFIYNDDFNNHLKNLPAKCIIKGNRDHLHQGFYNIIQNAVKYSKKGGELFIDLNNNDEKGPHVSFRDNGIGIDNEFINDIFLEFVRSPNAKDLEAEGSGIGLAITKEVLEEHNATIDVFSEINKGTTFFIKFRSLIG